MKFSVLIVEDEENARTFLKTHLTSINYEVFEAESLAEAKLYIDAEKADIVLLDVKLPDGNGLSLLESIILHPNRIPVILMTAYGDIDMAVGAMKSGALDFLQKPIDFNLLELSLKKGCEQVAFYRELTLYRQSNNKYDFVIGNSSIMQSLYEQAKRAAATSVSVLITGETGTGKEILARMIHQSGPRAHKPYVGIDSGAIQTTMYESELFGYEAGAFTSAQKRKHGLLEIADGGILFLDEISSMPLDAQSKLLRALNDRNFRRVGGTAEIKVDVQVLAASNRNLKQMTENGTFRDDLYYRLKVVDLHLPPLRERKEDIPELIGFFIRKNNPRLGINITGVTQRAMDVLCAHNWPGNIRELGNTVERAMIFCDDEEIDLIHLPIDLSQKYSTYKTYESRII